MTIEFTPFVLSTILLDSALDPKEQSLHIPFDNAYRFRFAGVMRRVRAWLEHSTLYFFLKPHGMAIVLGTLQGRLGSELTNV
jgi:hypothetical protein